MMSAKFIIEQAETFRNVPAVKDGVRLYATRASRQSASDREIICYNPDGAESMQ